MLGAMTMDRVRVRDDAVLAAYAEVADELLDEWIEL